MPNKGTANSTEMVKATVVDNEPVGDLNPGIMAKLLALAINKNSVPAKYKTCCAFCSVTSTTRLAMVFTIHSTAPRHRLGGASGRRFLVTNQEVNTNTAITIQVLTIVALSSKPSTTATMVSSGRSEERRVGKECKSRWTAYH